MFLEYKLEADALILGERTKGGVFRPSAKTIRYSQISGALRNHLGIKDIHAVGVIDSHNTKYFVYSPHDKVARKSKIPITVEVLTDVKGIVYMVENELLRNMPTEFNIFLGGLKTKGFGLSKLTFIRRIGKDVEYGMGCLNTRIPEKIQDLFLIRKVIKPIYGYLFEPTSESTGIYVKSLFEGSIVVGPKFLMKEILKHY